MRQPGKLLLSCLICLGSLLALDKHIAEYQKQVASVGSLTDELVEKYIAAYRSLRENGADFLGYMSGGKQKQQEGFRKFEALIQTAGFTDYAEFVKVNARIAWAFNMAQGAAGISSFEKQQEEGMKQFDDGIAQFDEQLANPEVPEESKKELRKARAQLVTAKAQVAKQFQKNKKYAGAVMNKLQPLTNKGDTEVVLRHEAQLKEIFSGMNALQMQKIQDASAAELKGKK